MHTIEGQRIAPSLLFPHHHSQATLEFLVPHSVLYIICRPSSSTYIAHVALTLPWSSIAVSPSWKGCDYPVHATLQLTSSSSSHRHPYAVLVVSSFW